MKLAWVAAVLLAGTAATASERAGGERGGKARAPKPTARLLRESSCTAAGCHDDLLAGARIHGPVQVGACNACHKIEDDERHTFRLARGGKALCAHCHGEMEDRTFPHKPVQEKLCTECHDPHKSATHSLLAAPSEGELCRRCHEPVTGKKVAAHEPAARGECAACHSGHGSDSPKLLAGSARAVCLSCHKEFATELARSRFTHGPATHECLRCHEAHESDHPHQLRSEAPELCAECHAKEMETFAASPVPHGALDTPESCTACHNPHASDLENLLAAPPLDLCLRCHDRPVQAAVGLLPDMKRLLAENPYPHGPVAQKNCTACHGPHGSEGPRLLAEAHPMTFYAPFDLATYAHCFRCHNQDIVLVPETDRLTEFRDGRRNLHYLHVNRKPKGRTCRTCHETHASHQQRHIAEKVPFGRWSYPLKYEKTETGGSCFVGCHEKMGYDREDPLHENLHEKSERPAATERSTKEGGR